MKLTAESVSNIFTDCLFRADEVIDGKPIIEPIIAEGIISKFGFHPDRLKAHLQEVKDMLSELPDQFKESKGGGWTFLNACMTKDDVQWGEHQNMEQLFALGNALGLSSYTMPRDMWHILPGGMPYVVVKV